MSLQPWLRLLRVGTLFSPAADVMAGACVAALPLDQVAGRTMLASICLYAAGMVCNDHADRAIDAVQRPERPLPRGQIKPAAALTLAASLLAAALILSPFRLYYLAMAALVVAYDYGVKRSALAGASVMGVLRGMNLLAGALPALAAGGLTSSIWIPAAAYGIYIFAVTCLGILEDERRPPLRAVLGLVLGAPTVLFLVLLATPQPWPAAAIAAVPLIAHVARTRGGTWDTARIRVAMTWLLLGTMVYTGLLCGGHGRWYQALTILAAIIPARWISRRIALT